MANLRSLLLIASALGVLVNLLACTDLKSLEKLSSTPPASTAQLNTKVRQQSKVRLDFREQKPGTEAQLQTEQQVRQELLQKQAELKQPSSQTTSSPQRISKETAANQAALKRSDVAIASLFGKAALTEQNITEAYAEKTSSNSSNIGLKFDADGSKTFTALTKKLAGTGRTLGIFLNGRLISFPTVASEYAQTGITGGTAVAEKTSSNSSNIGLKFDADGSKTFTALTKKLAGTGRTLGIFLNGRLISFPTVASEYAQTGITGGTAVISGNFSPSEAERLAAELRGDLAETSSEPPSKK